MENQTKVAACLGIGLAMAWPMAQQSCGAAIPVQLTYQSNTDISNAYVYFSYFRQNTSFTNYYATSVGTLSVASTPRTIAMNLEIGDYQTTLDVVGHRLTVNGVYGSGVEGAVIGFDAARGGQLASTPTPWANGLVSRSGSPTDEATVIAYLKSDDTASLCYFDYLYVAGSGGGDYLNCHGLSFGETGTLVGFSNSKSLGSFSVAVPEPSTLCLAGTLVFLLTRRRGQVG